MRCEVKWVGYGSMVAQNHRRGYFNCNATAKRVSHINLVNSFWRDAQMPFFYGQSARSIAFYTKTTNCCDILRPSVDFYSSFLDFVVAVAVVGCSVFFPGDVFHCDCCVSEFNCGFNENERQYRYERRRTVHTVF